jgi:hypothetical protein
LRGSSTSSSGGGGFHQLLFGGSKGLILDEEVSEERKKSEHVVEEKLDQVARVVVGGSKPQKIRRLNNVERELSHLSLGDDELDRVQEGAEVSGLAGEGREEVVAVHGDVHERVELRREVGVAAGALEGDEEPDDEDGRVVVHVQERDLAVVLLEHHDHGVDELGQLRDVEDPDELRHAPRVGVGLDVDGDVPERESRRGRRDADREPHVRRERKKEKVVREREALERELAGDELPDGVQRGDDDEVEERREEDALGVHEGQLRGERVHVLLAPGGEPLHRLGRDGAEGGAEGGDGAAEGGLELGGDAVHEPVGEFDELGDLLSSGLHFKKIIFRRRRK